jgi:antitoxin component of MazEF toxin-antitoxin module
MNPRKILQVGTNLGIALPMSLVRSMGWLRGDRVAVFQSGGDIVIRNDSKRAARFRHLPENRREQLAGVTER